MTVKQVLDLVLMGLIILFAALSAVSALLAWQNWRNWNSKNRKWRDEDNFRWFRGAAVWSLVGMFATIVVQSIVNLAFR